MSISPNVYALDAQMIPSTMPSNGSDRPRESSRSSRRKMGSSGPPVVLGGGAGVLGTAGVERMSDAGNGGTELRSQPSVFYNSSAPSPTASHLPIPLQSSNSPAFPSPTSPFCAGPPSPMPLPSTDTRSTNSLSTTASTSSRTLKTPHSKFDPEQLPVIASGSGSLDGHGSPIPGQHFRRQKESVEPRSPTPTKQVHPSYEGRKSSEYLMRDRLPPPAGPLPPTPANASASTSAVTMSTRPLRVSSRARQVPPAPLEMQIDKRLSQDWVQINPSAPSEDRSAFVSSASPRVSEAAFVPQRQPARLPVAKMVPMRETNSPQRPAFERTHTAPSLSPSATKQEEAQRQGRGSLDQLRDTNSTRPSARHASLSTPPAAAFESADSTIHPTGARLHLWRNGPSQPEPPLRTRRSEDLLRPTTDAIGAPVSKKDFKAMQKEQQKSLGVASNLPLPPTEGERKSSGLSLKKSSGALKALFTRGASGKGKDRAERPPMPSAEEQARVRSRPSTAPTLDESRPRPSFGRPRTPGSPSPSSMLSAVHASSHIDDSRSSLSVERELHRAPPMHRAVSEGSHAVLDLPTRSKLPLRDLRAPPDPRDTTVTPPLQSAPAETLPSSSSLPYLDQFRASVLLSSSEGSGARGSDTNASATHSSPASAARPSPKVAQESSLKPSRSLHLLQLPELDLKFDVAFDSIGFSPETPRKVSSRRISAIKLSPKSPPPQRSVTTKRSPKASPNLYRTASERRRSQSFDGPPNGASMLNELWRTDEGKLLLSSSSASAPMLSKPLEQFFSPEQPTSQSAKPSPHHSHSRSLSSDPSVNSSADHARTPSNASSINETPSPSPPHTPKEERTLAGLGFGDLDSQSSGPTPTPSPFPAEGSSMMGKPFVLHEPPSIPLPAVPAPAVAGSLAPPADIEPIKTVPAATAGIRGPRENKRMLQTRSRVMVAETNWDSKAIGREIQQVLYSFRYASGSTCSADRSNLIRSDLLPLLAEVEKTPHDPGAEKGNAILRETCFEWAEVLLDELRVEQAANERGACLEGLAAVMESSCLSESALQNSQTHRYMFTQMMVRGMGFVMGKLGAKGVFHNTLLFSGRFLAFAFFRVPHVGEQLVTVLQPPRGALMRFTMGCLPGIAIPPIAQPQYPEHLLPLCFDNSRDYTARLKTLAASFSSEEERDAFLFQPGNWLRRWQSDDSELFPAFYRAYHRQLALYLAPAIGYFEAQDLSVPASLLLRAPGYAHLATIFAKKCHSYILGSVNAVTTSSSAQSFEATETAGFRGSQKPAVLETANRRLVETLSTFSNLRVMIPDTKGRIIECDGSQLWSEMIDLWTKNIISKTSLYAPKGVFSLFDLLDGIVDPPCDPMSGDRALTGQSLLDVPHLIYVIRMILVEGEHALTLVKVIAFVFTHWEVLTVRPEDRKELCLELLLEKTLFERLLLFWSQSVRSYVLRLVVFRLAHIQTSKEDGEGHEVEMESVRLLQTRLDGIKKRHDELEPGAPAESDIVEEGRLTPVEGGITRSRSTITMVSDSPRPISATKAERLLGLGFGAEIEDGGKRIGKATSWLKKSFGKQKKRKAAGGADSPSSEGSPSTLYPSPELGSSRDSKESPRLGKYIPALPSPASRSSNEFSNGSGSPTENTRKGRPPTILTTSPAISTSPASNGFAFEFELPTVSPRSDTFDPTPTPSSPRRNSQPPSPHQPQSPHMSKSFSKRSSLLPPQTASALEAAVSPRVSVLEPVSEEGYDRRLHAYAIRMLAELEDAQKEYDEWWSDGGVGRMDGAPPRLTVTWPFHEGEE